jgi:hypothetical protein
LEIYRLEWGGEFFFFWSANDPTLLRESIFDCALSPETRARIRFEPVPQPRLVGIELNPGPFPLPPGFVLQNPPADYIAQARHAMATMTPAQLEEFLIRLAFTSGTMFQEGSALQRQLAHVRQHSMTDPRTVDLQADAALIQQEMGMGRPMSTAAFIKHHRAVKQAKERREDDFRLAAIALHEAAVKMQACDAVVAEVQSKHVMQEQRKALMDQARQQANQAQQLKQQARALGAAPTAASTAVVLHK